MAGEKKKTSGIIRWLALPEGRRKRFLAFFVDFDGVCPLAAVGVIPAQALSELEELRELIRPAASNRYLCASPDVYTGGISHKSWARIFELLGLKKEK